MKNTFEHFEVCKNILSTKRNIVITMHQNPDGDAMGASLGLNRVLKQAGHQVTVVSPNKFPVFLNWLSDSENVVIASVKTDAAKNIITNAEIIFCLDYNEISRAGDELAPILKNAKATKIMIDHHPDIEDFTDYVFSDTTISSASELVYEFSHLLAPEHIDKQVAECFFAGIMTDTGSFHFNSSNPRTFEIIGILLSKGINKDLIYSRVYDNYSANRMQLLGYCLNEKLVVMPEFHTAFISLTKSELDRFNYIIGDTEGFVNYPLSIEGIIFSALFIEKKKLTKLSFRSKGDFSTTNFARKNFNGGGHLNASGGDTTMNIDDTISKFKNLLPQYKDEIVAAFNKIED